jgi:hypothetical protein
VTTRIHNMLEARLLYRQAENYNGVLDRAAASTPLPAL